MRDSQKSKEEVGDEKEGMDVVSDLVARSRSRKKRQHVMQAVIPEGLVLPAATGGCVPRQRPWV